MKNDFDEILDSCIDRLNGGESLEACLNDYPACTERLKLLLQVVVITKEAISSLPSVDAMRSARQRFYAALDDLEQRQERRRSIFPWLLDWSGVLATTAVLVVAILGFFGMRSSTLPTEISPASELSPQVFSPQASPEGNFAFLISDDVNAISDFEMVEVSISRVGLTPRGSSDSQVEFAPEISGVDLTLVQGEATQEIWRGNIPEGEYSKVFIEVSAVRGILKDSEEEVEIKLPSQRLHISRQFYVAAGTVTTFTYDLTVIAAGNSHNGIKYILRPQVDQSGADYKSSQSQGDTKKEQKQQGVKPSSNSDWLSLMLHPVLLSWYSIADTRKDRALYKVDNKNAA